MSSNRVIHQASYALALVVSLVAGCNNIMGLDKISVSDEPSLPAGSNAGGSTSGGANEHGGTVSTSSGAGGSSSVGGSSNVPMGDCTTNQECTDRAEALGLAGAAAEAEATPSVCVKTPIPHCVQLLSADCSTITGNYLDNTAIVIGSLFSTKGPTAATNLPRQQSAT